MRYGGSEGGGALLYIFEIGGIGGLPSVEVFLCVISYGVTLFVYTVKYVGIGGNVFADAEETGFGIVLLEIVEYDGGDLADGAIIEGQIEYLLSCSYFPKCSGEKPARSFGSFDYRQVSSICLF